MPSSSQVGIAAVAGANVLRHRWQSAWRRQRLADHRRLVKHAGELAEHRVRLSCQRSQASGRQQRLALVELEPGAEGILQAPVALACERFDPAMGDDSIRFPFPDETGDDLDALARDDEKA